MQRAYFNSPQNEEPLAAQQDYRNLLAKLQQVIERLEPFFEEKEAIRGLYTQISKTTERFDQIKEFIRASRAQTWTETTL